MPTLDTVGDLSDRRARKKARTRAEILGAAQELFAERGFDGVTIADVAGTADVAVQTVFNHFATKEELFFAGRVPWVDGPADAVRHRPAGVLPLTALRGYTLELVHGFIAETECPDRRHFVDLIRAAPSLCAFELELQHRTQQRLAAALAEAWAVPPPDDDEPVDAEKQAAADYDVRIAASLTAALWVSAARSLAVELRDVHEDGADADRIKAAVENLAERVFTRLEGSLATLLQLPARPADGGQPVPARRAG